ncbi:MAG TPA: trypsin-like peptidase domain-containing protein [Blastocatellia bacterium]|nr:trypsin-like peptidase domain-containing protein [Blastocatellia bacterium]
MKPTYQITARQLIALALLAAVFAASAVLVYDKFGAPLLGRMAGAKADDKAKATATADAGISDPSVATDEKNNAEVYQALSPSVVNITSTTYVQDWFAVVPQKGTGSGSIIDKEGNILTNYHVVQDTQELDVALSNNKHYKARIVGEDQDNDLAIIRISAPKEDLKPIPLGDSKALFVGQKVLAIGNPFGFDHTLTTGIVSGLARPLRSEFTGRLIEGGVVQTDAAINPGNSGGPLLDSRGRLVGINTMIYSPSGASAGIGFAVPVDTAKRVASDILAYGRVRRPSLAVVAMPLNTRLADALDLPVTQGWMISEVAPGGTADSAGIRGGRQPVRIGGSIFYIGGDIITAIDGQPIRSGDDIDRLINAKNIGDHVQIEIVRSGSRTKLDAVLKEMPAGARRRA